MRDIGNREAEMEAGRIAHGRIACRNIRMHRIGCLDIGEGRDDDPPDAFRRIERQKPLVALGQGPHHGGFPTGPEGRAGFGGLLHGDEAVDDRAPLHQEPVHGLIDPVDLLAQVGEGGNGRVGRHEE
jgi:hypothetical protein